MSLTILELFERMVQVAADAFLLPSLLALLMLGGWCAWEFGSIFAEAICIGRKGYVSVCETIGQYCDLRGKVYPECFASLEISFLQREMIKDLYNHRHLSAEYIRNIGNLLIARDEMERSKSIHRAQMAAKLGILLGVILAVISLAASSNGISGAAAKGAAINFDAQVEYIDSVLKACSFVVVGFGIACSACIISYIRKRRMTKYITDTRMMVEVFIEILKG